MSEAKVLILGASGMLGSTLFRTCHAAASLNVTATVRNSASLSFFSETERCHLMSNVDVLDSDGLISLLNTVDPDVVINCVGLIKQLSSAKDPLVALPINALFPHRLARLCEMAGARLIHISTDCVFSGSTGNYTEECVSDAEDLYGKSKYLGEIVDYSNAVTLRTSIIGRELNTAHSLVDWFLAQSGTVKGYTKAIFSGLPTCELARVICDFVIPNPSLTGLFHVSAKAISKHDLLLLIAAEYKKEIEIIADHRVAIDRSLNSKRFTDAANYVAPQWPELIRRMHNADLRGDR
ncbi:dTDP-4-dehydrorhamnose reductase family protein [Rhizobium leguminosarum]|uniref:dTDP-4-dehydrorhamnose reductase family protein n=1 Tax=Rhizobium leguminosarum TaxID=384 RepID=UPI0028F3F18A|nr:SDR family oxidoreductase [Rhizobium leguminosarum]